MTMQPNILWIQTDEQRPDSLGCYGSDWARTPNIDALAASGTIFERAFCQSPVCVPSRTSQLAGRYPQECNTLNNALANCPLQDVAPGITFFPQIFRDAGYETVSLGKWHTPHNPTWERTELMGLDRRYAGFFGLADGYDEDEYHVIKRPGGTSVILAGTYPVRAGNPGEVLTDKAIEFLQDRSTDRPFLLRVSFNWPHTPVLPPPPFQDTYAPDEIPIRYFDEQAYNTRSARDRARADTQRVRELSRDQIRQVWKDYMGLVAYVDYEVGRLLDVLTAAGSRENTIVMFSADHGKLLGEWGATEKGVFDDQVWRVPFIWSWPGHIAAGERRRDLCEIMDTARTLLALAGLDCTPPDCRGRNLFADPAPAAVFGQIGYPNVNARVLQHEKVRPGPLKPGQAMRIAVRTDRYRMDIDWMRDGKRVPFEQADGNLFDLGTDPLERHNLWNDPGATDIAKELHQYLRNWQDRIVQNPELLS